MSRSSLLAAAAVWVTAVTRQGAGAALLLGTLTMMVSERSVSAGVPRLDDCYDDAYSAEGNEVNDSIGQPHGVTLRFADRGDSADITWKRQCEGRGLLLGRRVA